MPLTLGTDCTGIDAALTALLKVRTDVEYVFASDLQPEIREYLQNMHQPPSRIFKNVAERVRALDAARDRVDLYIAGFPCQSFSQLGSRQGFGSEQGCVFFDIFTYLQTCEPKVFILENVTGLLNHEKGSTFERIMSMLHGLNYCMGWRVVSPTDIGFPQSRRRVFIVGIHNTNLKDAALSTDSVFDNLDTTTHISLTNLLQNNNDARCMHPPCARPLTERCLDNLELARLKYQRGDGVDIRATMCMVNIGASKGYQGRSDPGICPCLKTYSQYYYITTRHRYITHFEALSLQGFENSEAIVARNPKIKPAKWFYWAGNSVCVSVLEALIRATLCVCTL